MQGALHARPPLSHSNADTAAETPLGFLSIGFLGWTSFRFNATFYFSDILKLMCVRNDFISSFTMFRLNTEGSPMFSLREKK